MAEQYDSSIGEWQDKFNSNLEALEQGLSTDPRPTTDIIAEINSTDLIENRKQVMINTVKRLRGEDTSPVQVQPEVQPEEQVSAEPQQGTSFSGGSFFSDIDFTPITSFFDDISLKINRPRSPVEAAEIATLVTVGSIMDGVEPSDSPEVISAELSTTGASQAYSEYVTMREGKEIQSINDSLWGNLAALKGIQGDPEFGVVAQKDVDDEILDIKTTDKVAQMVADVTFNMTPEQLQLFQQFQFIQGEALYRRSLNDMLAMRDSDLVSKANWLDWVESLTTPLIGADLYLTRRDGGKLLKIIQDGIGESTSVSQYYFKTAHADRVVSYLTEEGIPLTELDARLSEVDDLIQEADSLDSSFNPLNGSELIAEIRSALSTQSIDRGVVMDTLDAAVLAAVVKPLRSLGKLLSAKVFGKTAMAGAKWDADSINAVNDIINSMIEESAIASRASYTRAPTDLSVQTGQGSLFDNLVAANPEQTGVMLRAAVENGDITVLGITQDQLLERVIPLGSNPTSVHAGLLTGNTSNVSRLLDESKRLVQFRTELTSHTPLNLLRQGELEEVADKYSAMVVANSRGTLHPAFSPISSEADGVLSVQATFGKSAEGGYDTFEEAEEAAKFLFSDSYEIVAHPRGIQSELSSVSGIPAGVTDTEFFIRHKATIVPDTRYTNPLPMDRLFASNIITDSVQSVSKRIDKELFDIFSSYADKSTRLSQVLSRIPSAVLRMNAGRDKDQWTKMLVHGDDNEIVFTSRQQAEQAIGTRITDRAWEGYTATREVYDALAEVRQRAVYSRLNSGGYKSIYVQGGILKDPDGLVHGRPIVDRPVIRATKPEEGEVGAGTSLWGKEIYDVSTGRYVALTDELLDSVYSSSDSIIVQLNRYSEFSTGKESAHAIVPMSSVRELTSRPMNIRPGHVDVNYAPQSLGLKGFKGGNRYKVDVVVKTTVNGVDDSYRRAVGIYDNQKQADNARAAMIQRELSDPEFGGSPTEADIKAIEDKYFVDVTREGARQMDIDSAGTLSNLPAHSRKRGETTLNGYSGIAEVLSLEESLTRAVREARNLLGAESIDMMKSRFQKSFAQYIKGYDGFHDTFSRFQFTDAAVKDGIKTQAESWHRAVINMQNSLSGSEVSMFLHKLDEAAFALANEGKTLQGAALGAVNRGVSKALQLNKEVTTTLFIASRMAYQMLANSAQLMNLFIQNPYDFGQGALRGTIGVISGVMSGGKIPSSVLAKAINVKMTGAQYDKYIANLQQSGLFSTTFSDDILSVVAGASRIEAGRHSLASSKFWGGLVKPTEVNRKVSKTLMVPQSATINMANLFSYNHAASRLIRKKGLDYVMSRQGQRELLADTRRLTFNQNRTDQFLYQQNAFTNTHLMFLQHVHRMSMDMLIDPALRVVSGNKLKLSKDGTNLYADTYAQSLMTLGMTAGVLGVGNMLPDWAADKTEDMLVEGSVPHDMVTTFLDGAVGLATEETFGDRYDVASRISHVGALTSTLEMMRTNDGGWIIGGASTVLPNVFTKVGQIAKAYFTTEVMDTELAMEMMAQVGTKYFAGLRDVEKAYIAYTWGNYIDSNRRPIAHVSDNSWLPVLFSIPPEKVQSMYDQMNLTYDATDKARDISRWAKTAAMGKLMEKPADQLTGNDIIAAAVFGYRVVDSLTQGKPRQNELAKEGLLQSLTLGPDAFLAEHAQKIITNLESKDAYAELQRMKALNPEHAPLAEFLMSSLSKKDEQ